MYKSIILPAMLFLSVSCTRNTATPIITIGNTEVFYTDAPNGNMYTDLEARKKAMNMIQVSLTNPGDKKLIFVIDREKILPRFKHEKDINYGLLHFEIIIPDGKCTTAHISSNCMPAKKENEDCTEYRNYYTEALEKYNKLDVETNRVMDVYNLINHELILLPGETKSFYVQLSLPILNEYVPECNYKPVYFDSIPDNSRFRIKYSYDTKGLKEALPEYLREELERNGYEIFDGEITTESIPLIKR